MAKALRVQTDRSPAKKIPLSGSGGIAQSVGIAAQEVIHTVPEGYRDEIYVWANNADAANDGQILFELNGVAALSIVGAALNREIRTAPYLEGMIIEARTADVVIDCLAITEPVVVWGYVYRTALED